MGQTRWSSQLVPEDATQAVGKVFIPITHFWGAAAAGLGTGTPAQSAELTTSGISGLLLGADNDEFDCLWMIPQDCDLSQDLQFNLLLHWAAASASGDQIDMAMTYNVFTPDSAGLADATTTTGVTNPTNGTIAWIADDYVTKATSVFLLAGGTLSDNSRYIHLQFTVTDLDSGTSGPSADEVSLLGCEVTYTRRFV